MLVPLYLAATATGYACALAHVPLPWLIGPLLVTAAASIRFGAMPVPVWTRAAGQVIVASAIGINLTASAVAYLVGNVGPMLIGGVVLIGISLLVATSLARFGGVDKATALFSALPGGPAELAILAEKYGGRGGLVALSQMLRIAVIVTLVPALLLLGGLETHDSLTYQVASDPLRLPLVLAIGLGSAVVLHAAKVLNAYFLGPLLGVGLATFLDLPVTPIPWLLIVLAQVFLGTTLGSMFTLAVLRYAARFVVHAVWVSAFITLAGVGSGLAIALWTGQHRAALVLANAPGGAAEMAVVAKTMSLDVTLVAAYHVVRVLMIVPTAELIFRAFDRMTHSL